MTTALIEYRTRRHERITFRASADESGFVTLRHLLDDCPGCCAACISNRQGVFDMVRDLRDVRPAGSA